MSREVCKLLSFLGRFRQNNSLGRLWAVLGELHFLRGLSRGLMAGLAPRLGRRQSSVFSGNQPKRGPIFIRIPARHRGNEPVANDARDWHWDALRLSRLEHKTHILESERKRESNLVVVPFDDQAAVGLVDRRIKKRRSQKVHKSGCINPGLTRKCNSFRKR